MRDDLDALGAQWAVVGGLAVSVRAEPRFTRDVDVVVGVADDAGAEGVVAALHARGYRPYASIEQLATGRLATERLWAPEGSGVRVDLLFASSGLEAEVAAAADRLEVLPGLVVPVACAGHLVVLKLLSRDGDRPRDHADLLALAEHLEPAERARAEAAAALVMSRGTHRGRDVPALLRELLRT
ncbi:MAG: nucleotidyl transferase AbiEii/AbiGii toxin family protein [Myxococcales bacterium]|nr:nucleotidyl transferase AbiEii/AbiGii toxin family protein [Myxococcales bacterium]